MTTARPSCASLSATAAPTPLRRSRDDRHASCSHDESLSMSVVASGRQLDPEPCAFICSIAAKSNTWSARPKPPSATSSTSTIV